MFKRNKVEGPISESQMKKLINLMLKAKSAKEEFEAYKKEITKDLMDGDYIVEDVGKISKSTYASYLLDKEALKLDHPEIDLECYQKEVIKTKLDIRNLSEI